MGRLEYKVRSFVPTIKGCNGTDMGWDPERCEDFQNFLNSNTPEGWRLHSCEYRYVVTKGCGGGKSQWLVCIFERTIS